MDNYHTLKRIHCPDIFANGSIILIDGIKFHHLNNVLRTKPGMHLRVFNQQSGEWLAEVIATQKDKLKLSVIKKLRNCESIDNISLMFTPLKPDKLHFMIEKSVELGVGKLIPILTERTVIRDLNHDKIHSYITQATQQCERISIPELSELTRLENAISSYPSSRILFCDEQERDLSLNILLSSKLGIQRDENYIILIGPEGGFTDKERDYLKQQNNVTSIHIGPRILRAETAAIYSISCLQFALNNMITPPRVITEEES